MEENERHSIAGSLQKVGISTAQSSRTAGIGDIQEPVARVGARAARWRPALSNWATSARTKRSSASVYGGLQEHATPGTARAVVESSGSCPKVCPVGFPASVGGTKRRSDAVFLCSRQDWLSALERSYAIGSGNVQQADPETISMNRARAAGSVQ